MRKKRKRSSSPSFQSGKQLETEGISFFALLAGMVTSFLVVLLVWNYYSTPAATAVALAVESGDQTVAKIDPKDFEGILKLDDAEKLVILLADLDESRRDPKLAIRIQANNRRVEVANKMLSLSLNDDQRKLAIETRLEALSAIYGLDRVYQLKLPNVAETLRDAAELYVQEKDPGVVRAARLAILKLNAFERSKVNALIDPKDLAADMIRVLKEFPRDQQVMLTINMIVQYETVKDSGDRALQIIDSLLQHASEFEDPAMKAFFVNLSDSGKLAKSNFGTLYTNRLFDGAVGRVKLLETTMELAADPDGGERLIGRIDLAGHWFEQCNQYDQAIAIYDQLLQTADKYQTPLVSKLAREVANNGLKRSRLVGQRFEFNGFTVNGSRLDSKNYENRMVVIVFWSAEHEPSQRALTSFYRDSLRWRRDTIPVIAVCIDENPGEEFKQTVVSMNRFEFAAGDPLDQAHNPLLDQSPSKFVPRAMIVGPDGLVIDVNVPLPDLKAEVDFLSEPE